MNRVFDPLLNDWYVHHCAAVFNGEWRVIDNTKIRDFVRQVDDGSSGLDKWEANDSIYRDMWARCNKNACRGTIGR
jgi:hypothetical protein